MAQLQALLWTSHSALELITSSVLMQLTGAEAQTFLHCLPTDTPMTVPLQTCSHSMAC
jgi:ornithine carbamoyltransferase